LTDERSSPRIVIHHVLVEVLVDLSNGEQAGRIEIRRDACESLDWYFDENWEANVTVVLNSMLGMIFLGKF